MAANDKYACAASWQSKLTSPRADFEQLWHPAGAPPGAMFASIFSQDPNFKGRRALTFHNQRDYIFFRSAPTMPAVAATHHGCL